MRADGRGIARWGRGAATLAFMYASAIPAVAGPPVPRTMPDVRGYVRPAGAALPVPNPRRGTVTGAGGPVAAAVVPDHPLPRRRPARTGTAALATDARAPTAAPLALVDPAAPTAPAAAAAAFPNAGAMPLVTGRTATAFDRYDAVSGSFREALDALRADRYEEVFKRRNGLRDPLERKTIDWLLMRSGSPKVTAAMIAAWAQQSAGWPDGELTQVRVEQALAREKPGADTVLRTFAGTRPVSNAGKRLLARAYLAKGDRARAAALVREVWRTSRLTSAEEAQIRKEFGKLLTANDHRLRAEMHLYRDRIAEAQRLKGSLPKADRLYIDARAAVSQRRSDAGAKIKAVPSEARKRAGYLFARIAKARRDEDYVAAAKLLEKAPRDPAVLIDPDEWWVERRIVSRGLIEKGEFERAYRIAANHSAQSDAAIADAEFHAGWYALRFLKNPGRARAHFERLRKVGTTPITVSRAEYWLGRTAEAAGNSATARRHYRNAAAHGSAYYGQLAREKLGERSAGIGVVKPTAADRVAFDRNELVRAVRKLIAADHQHRTWPLLEHLAETVPTVGQAVLVVDLAGETGRPHYALNVAKAALRRGLDVGAAAFPTGAIPASARYPDGLDKAIVYAIARQESTFNQHAISPAGARGLLQLMPGTAKILSRRVGVGYSQAKLVTDPAYNVTLGARFLGDLLERFDGSYVLTFAAYNAGPNRSVEWVERFGDPRNADPDAVVDWVELIPFTETRNYVQRVMENVQAYRERLGTGRLAIEADLARGGKG